MPWINRYSIIFCFWAISCELHDPIFDNSLDLEAAQLEIEHYWAGALRRAVIDGDVEFGSVMAGQSVGMVKKEQPVAEIIQELVGEAQDAFAA